MFLFALLLLDGVRDFPVSKKGKFTHQSKGEREETRTNLAAHVQWSVIFSSFRLNIPVAQLPLYQFPSHPS